MEEKVVYKGVVPGQYMVICCAPQLSLGDPCKNAQAILAVAEKYTAASLVLFPELVLTGYSCGDLFLNKQLLLAVEMGLRRVMEGTRKLSTVVVVGFPLLYQNRLFDCAAVISQGKIQGISGKRFLFDRGEYSESRWFTPFDKLEATSVVIAGETVPVGNLLYGNGDLSFGIEFGRERYAVCSPTEEYVSRGATLILNPSAEMADVGEIRRINHFVSSQATRFHLCYCHVNAPPTESTGCGVYSGEIVSACDGKRLQKTHGFELQSCICQRIPLLPRWLNALRRQEGNLCACASKEPYIGMDIPLDRTCSAFPCVKRPFLPQGEVLSCEDELEHILNIQSTGLAQRAIVTHSNQLVLGLSGGLDSTLALLVCLRTCVKLGWDPMRILAVTMPGMGTGKRTKSNAVRLAAMLGVDLRTIPIGRSVLAHFKDIGHDPSNKNVAYENAQARERTQILMDLANENGGIVVGTGDLSEIALGWCTYNGDHIAMYSVNCDIPKTLVRELVSHCATCYEKTGAHGKMIGKILKDIVDTPVSPELVPGKQNTEEIIGDYDLHDFFLFYFLKYGETPGNLYAMARIQFQDEYTPEYIAKVLQTFLRRFMQQQFKRNCAPDGPKVCGLSLASKGGWEMPSDIRSDIWQLIKEGGK